MRRVVPVVCFTCAGALLVSAGFLAGRSSPTPPSGGQSSVAQSSVVQPSGDAPTEPPAEPSADERQPAAPGAGTPTPASAVPVDELPVPSAGAEGTPTATPTVGAGAPEAPTVVDTPAAVSITIPSLEVDQPLVDLDVEGSSLQVPEDYDDIGWWRDGPAPGDPGAAVVVGHVDSKTGPAVFYGLASLEPGAEVRVGRADGSVAEFRVSKVERLPRANFPSERVYREDGFPSLHLITCGGEYDAEAGRYEDNVVVSAYLVGISPGKAVTPGNSKPTTAEEAA